MLSTSPTDISISPAVARCVFNALPVLFFKARMDVQSCYKQSQCEVFHTGMGYQLSNVPKPRPACTAITADQWYVCLNSVKIIFDMTLHYIMYLKKLMNNNLDITLIVN